MSPTCRTRNAEGSLLDIHPQRFQPVLEPQLGASTSPALWYYLFAKAYGFHPLLNPLRIRLPLGMLTLQHFPHAETKVESYRFTLLVEARRQWKSLLGLWNMTPRHFLWSTTELALCLFAIVATVRWTIPACDISWSREESAFSPLAIEPALFQCMSCAHPKIRHCARYNTCSIPFSGSMVA